MLQILFLLFAYIGQCQSYLKYEDYIYKAESKKLHLTQKWERLLHLENGIFGKKSEADSPAFFSTPETVDRPREELHSIIKLIITGDSPEGDGNILCRFPARSKWLKEELNLPDELFNFSQCKRYNEYIKNNLKSDQVISLVFSSYYLESPASAFGHTFFRIKDKEKNLSNENPNELLDTGISYAANMTTNNALMYAVLGMAGGFYGQYSILPYYYKIREYNDFESRDLWSYDLKLSDKEIHFLIDHLWELGHTNFRYFYFTENCSYELLRLLEATNPDLNLIGQIPYYVIPVDTIKAVHSSKLVTKIEFRPSTKRRLDFYLAQLNETEKKILFKLIEEQDLLTEELSRLNEKSQTKILDTLIQFLDFKYSKEILNQKGQHFEWKKKVLLARSSHGLRGVNEEIPLPEMESPHLGHGSTRTGLFFGNHPDDNSFAELQYRFAMHDILDPSTGHPPHANLEFFDIKLRYYESLKKLLIQDWTFVDVMTLNPWNQYQRPTSLKANVGLRRKPLPQCNNCLALNAEIGGGVTKSFKRTTFYLMGETDSSFSGQLSGNHTELAVGPSINGLHAWNESFLGLIQIKYFHYISSRRDVMIYDFEHRYHMKNDLSFTYSFNVWGTNFQHQLGLYYYF